MDFYAKQEFNITKKYTFYLQIQIFFIPMHYYI